MSRSSIHAALAIAVAAFVAVALPYARVSAQQETPAEAESPEDAAGRATLERQCSLCHEANLVQGPLRTPDEWNEVLDRMASYGADVNATVRPEILTFLLRNFGRIRVNTAPAEDLAPVLDISRDTADALVAYRAERGPFKTLDDLKAVPGVDPGKVDKRKDRFVF